MININLSAKKSYTEVVLVSCFHSGVAWYVRRHDTPSLTSSDDEFIFKTKRRYV
jgi:hypothetical protein